MAEPGSSEIEVPAGDRSRSRVAPVGRSSNLESPGPARVRLLRDVMRDVINVTEIDPALRGRGPTLSWLSEIEIKLLAVIRPWLGLPAVRWIALLGLCAAYLQGGFNKATDFSGAIAEMTHFGLQPAPFFAVATVALEIGASILVLIGFYRWLGALALAGFTLMATFIANRYWEMAPPERFMVANSFYEHLGLIGGFLLVAWHDINSRENILGSATSNRGALL